MFVEFFLDERRYVTSFRHGWDYYSPVCSCTKGGTCNNGGLHPPNENNVYHIKNEEFPLLENYILCRYGVRIVDGKKGYQLALGDNLFLDSDDDQNLRNLKMTKEVLSMNP